MIIRLIWWSLKIISICIIVAFIANQEGNSQIVWVGWKMEIPTSILFGSFLFLMFITASAIDAGEGSFFKRLSSSVIAPY